LTTRLECVCNCGSGGGSNMFCLKIHQNKIFYFLKIIFDINILKKYKNIKQIISNKKNLKFKILNLKNHDLQRFST